MHKRLEFNYPDIVCLQSPPINSNKWIHFVTLFINHIAKIYPYFTNDQFIEILYPNLESY